MSMGERGLLQRFGAVIWGGPKAWSFQRPNDPAEKASYTSAQYEAVRNAMAEYHPELPLVLGLDFGHTDPQQIVPFGGQITVDATNRKITAVY